MKKFFGVLAFLSFFYMLGAVGGVEQNMMGLGVGALHMTAGLVGFTVFTKLAGGFDYTR